MLVAFRADASIDIGTGHVMRCLTLADTLKASGAECLFMCREHEGNLIDLIRSKGFETQSQPLRSRSATSAIPEKAPTLPHSHLLGGTQEQDAMACISNLHDRKLDWLVVDHYALDSTWENALAPYCRKLMVIDDLADRRHSCDILLDQTFGRNKADYLGLVPKSCRLLCGSEFALLRPEFANLRAYSLSRRRNPQLRELLVTMGGVDKYNSTGLILSALRSCPLPADCRITIVMGATAPWRDKISSQAAAMPWATRVLVGVTNMAQLMADSDFAIGAAGATSWERCCLGLPTMMLVLADNQRYAAQTLENAGAAILWRAVDELENLLIKIIANITKSPTYLLSVSLNAACITDGSGSSKVAEVLNFE